MVYYCHLVMCFGPPILCDECAGKVALPDHLRGFHRLPVFGKTAVDGDELLLGRNHRGCRISYMYSNTASTWAKYCDFFIFSK